MSISTNIPLSFPIPGTWITVSSAGSSTNTQTYTVVIIATATDGATNTPVLASTTSGVQSVYGATSDLAKAYTRYRAVDPITTVYLVNAASSEATDITAALTSLGDIPANLIISPFNTAAAISAFDTFFQTRWSYNSGLDGIHVTAASDTVANLVTLGGTVNSAYSSITAFAPGSTDTIAEQAAAVGAVVAQKASAYPALPIQGITLNAALAPQTSTFAIADRTAIFNAGIGITKQDTYGNVYLERPRMTYQKNAEGTADDSYQDIEVLNILAYIRTDLQARLNSKFFGANSKKLVSNSTQIVPGSNAVNPNTIKAELIASYSDYVTALYCQDQDTFNANVSVEIQSPGIIAAYYPATVAGVLRQINIALVFSR
ncbi:MAG: hypothetical protein ABF479_02160 [Gluconacetobacter sp.]